MRIKNDELRIIFGGRVGSVAHNAPPWDFALVSGDFVGVGVLDDPNEFYTDCGAVGDARPYKRIRVRIAAENKTPVASNETAGVVYLYIS